GPTLDDSTTPGELVDRFEKRLTDRAKLAEMELVVELDREVADATLRSDIGVVEQILFNLVDNAAKYASNSEDRRIHLTATCGFAGAKPQAVRFVVRDYGPGYESERKATRSVAFSKSAQKAAESAPGVGLGLALCRRLAKQLGGKLEVANHAQGGAEATLTLPLAA
ncbi:MAG: ATP-binding protein, partial [Lacipirellulaceae bacterium]